MIKIHLIPAGYGDTILLQMAPDDITQKATYILIDCGFMFRKNILPLIESLKSNGMDKLDRLIITHYDSDHISSASSFIRLNGKSSSPGVIPVDQVWLNTFRHLQEEKRPSPKEEDLALTQNFIDDLPSVDDDPDLEYEIGARQAILLGKELLKNGYSWNSDFDNKAACIESRPSIQINDIQLHLLSPTREKLKKLETKFKDALAAYGIDVSDTALLDDAMELFLLHRGNLDDLETEYLISAAPQISADQIRQLSKGENYHPDDAPGNGSSIAFFVVAQNKRILMLADAHAELIITELERHFPDKTTYPIFFDAVKVAHHGSFKNNNPDLFKIIDSPLFLFSTNGDHQSHVHPDLETIACIINRPLTHGIEFRKLVFNYELEHLKDLDNDALKQEFNYEVEISTAISI